MNYLKTGTNYNPTGIHKALAVNGTIQIQANENDSGTSFLEQEKIKVDENQEIATEALNAALNRRRDELEQGTVDNSTEN